MGVYGEISHFLSDPTEIVFVPGYIKNVDTHHESFSYNWEVIKQLIAKKPLTTLYEMNSRPCKLMYTWCLIRVCDVFPSLDLSHIFAHVNDVSHIYNNKQYLGVIGLVCPPPRNEIYTRTEHIIVILVKLSYICELNRREYLPNSDDNTFIFL